MNNINLLQPNQVPTFAIGFKRLWSPWHNISDEVVKEVSLAKSKIRLIMYGFTLQPLIDTLIEKQKAGLDVKLILDLSQSKGKTEAIQVKKLQEAGVPMLIGNSPVAGQIIHEKAISVDEKRHISGSFNTSLSAQKQVNHMDFFWSKDLVDTFSAIFDHLWEAVLKEAK